MQVYAGSVRVVREAAPTERHKYRGGADVGIGPYETMKRNAAHKTADADRHDRWHRSLARNDRLLGKKYGASPAGGQEHPPL